MVIVHEHEKFKFIPKQLERIQIKYGNGVKVGNSIYLPRKTFYGENIPLALSSKIIPSIVSSIKNETTSKTDEGKGLEIIENISKEAADKILRKGKGFYFENV